LGLDAMLRVWTCFYIHDHGNGRSKHDGWNHKINHQAKLGSTRQDRVLIGKFSNQYTNDDEML